MPLSMFIKLYTRYSNQTYSLYVVINHPGILILISYNILSGKNEIGFSKKPPSWISKFGKYVKILEKTKKFGDAKSNIFF